jgi:hypothetical protein
MVMQVAFAVPRGFGQSDQTKRSVDWRCYAILSGRVVVKGLRLEHLAIESIAGMAELADAADSKSAEGNLVGVRPPLPAPTK